MKRSTAVLGAAVVVAGAFVLRQTTGFLGGNGKSDADITFTIVGTVCHADISNDVGGAWKNKIHWHVTNKCREPQYVSIGNYLLRPLLTPMQGIVFPDPATVPNGNPPPNPIPPNSSVTFDGRIDRFNFSIRDDTFKYRICVGTAPNPVPGPTVDCNDPDLDVWPF